MKPSNDLFHLIKSLTKSEKRFFKLFSSLQSGEKNYFKLYDYIEKLDEYDESQLKEHFKEENFIKHLPSEKNHLYKQILKSLRQFHGEQSISIILMQEIKNIEILYNKALYKEATKFLIRAKKIAHEHEKFYFIIDLIAWEKILIAASYEAGNFDVDLNNIIKEEEEVINKLRNLAEYQILYSRINAVFRSDGYTKNQEQRDFVNEIANHHLIKGKNTAISIRATSICYYIQGLCATTKREFEKSFEKFNKVKDILDENPKIKTDLNEIYILTLFHLMQSYIYSKSFSLAQNVLNQLKSLRGKKGFNSLHTTLKLDSILLTEQLNIYNLQGEFHKAYNFFHKNEISHLKLIEQSNKEQRIKFYFTMAYTLFAINDYKGSLYYVNLLMNDNEPQLRQDIYSFSRILNLLIHYELENHEHLEYASKSAIRFINKIKRDHQLEKVFIKHIRKIAKNATTLSAVPLIKEALEEVNTLLEIENERVILDFIDIRSWLETKITGEIFQKLVKEKLAH